jgi:hypothetical protein
MLITIPATLAYLGLAILGWGGFVGFFSHPPLIALAITLLVLSSVAVFSSGNLILGVREDRANRWVIVAFGLIGLLDAYLPADTDGKEFWTLDGENTPKTRSWPAPGIMPGFQYMALASNASLAESPIDILLWTIPLKSHFADAAQPTLKPSSSTPARSCTARHAAVDHELRTRDVAGRVGGEEEHAIRDILRLASLAERYPGFRNRFRE